MRCFTAKMIRGLHWIKCYEIIYCNFLQNLVGMYQYGKHTSHFASRHVDKTCAHLQCRLFFWAIFSMLWHLIVAKHCLHLLKMESTHGRRKCSSVPAKITCCECVMVRVINRVFVSVNVWMLLSSECNWQS